MARIPPSVQRERDRWRQHPRIRPAHVPPPGPGQESVWDYPRPPRIDREKRPVRVELDGRVLAASDRALRVVETASPPCFYLPPADVRLERLQAAQGTTLCEWKGLAHYWDARSGGRVFGKVAWSYPDPFEEYEELREHLAFFPARVDACFVGPERARPQPGSFYGGWITNELTGPFKGEAGSESW